MSINKTKVKEFLERFISGDMEVVNNLANGLCSNLEKYSEKDYYPRECYYFFVGSSCVGWNDIKDKECYPIEWEKGVGLYEGSQLKQRVSLAKHLLTKVDDYED